MPSTQLPSASNDYAAPQGMRLNKAAWDSAMVDIGLRLREIEGRAQNLQAVIDAGVGAALSMISQNVAPQITAVTGMISALEAQIATAEDAVAALLATQLPAANITFTPGGTLSSTNVQAAVAELASETATSLAAKADAAAVATALSGKADASALTSALAGVVNQKFNFVSANTTLVSGSAYRITGGTAITLTLPASPATGDTIRIIDGGVITPLNIPTLARNGATIMGRAESTTIDVPGVDFLVWWNGSDWRIF